MQQYVAKTPVFVAETWVSVTLTCINILEFLLH